MKIEKFQLRGKNSVWREHFSYCAATHPRVLGGTLRKTDYGINSSAGSGHWSLEEWLKFHRKMKTSRDKVK
jgi:hypothetical protein